MLLSRKRRKFDKTCERIAEEIYSEFGIKVAATTSVSPSALSDLQEALGVIYQHYGLSKNFGRQSGIEILLEKAVYENSSFFFRGNEINGMYEYGTNTIRLPVTSPGALVHELIHAIDYIFRNPTRDRSLTFIDDSGKDAFERFLKKRGAGEKIILDFEDVYKRMQGSMSEYLKTPSEIIARMGAYSFWNDNEEACEDNPFLKFSYAPYAELNRKTGSIKTIDQFPFHSIDAVRLFVHHASRDIAKEKPERWHPSFSREFAATHGSEWYRKAWHRLASVSYAVSNAKREIRENGDVIKNKPKMPAEDRRWYEDAIRRAQKELPMAKENKDAFVSFLAQEVMTEELQERMLNLSKDDRSGLVVSYLQECQTAARLREQELQAGGVKRKERER